MIGGSLKFRIRIFAIDSDNDIGGDLGGAGWVKDHSTTGSFDDRSDAREDRFAIGEFAVRIASALPGECPATGRFRDVIGAITDDEHRLVGGEGKNLVIVFEEHKRLSNSLACYRAVRRRSQYCFIPGIGACAGFGFLEHARGQFDPQDPAHSIVERECGPIWRAPMCFHKAPSSCLVPYTYPVRR